MNGPREFFEEMVLPARAEWHADILSERKARAVAIFLDSMADWIFVSCELKQQYSRPYRDYLSEAVPAFKLIRDTADCTKHMRLTRRNAASADAAQQKLLSHATVDEADDWDAIDDFATLSVWVVEDGQRQWFFRSLVDQVIDLWQRELKLREL